jgi:aspartyl-tRNA(Asn)/glutamyl-tRNA(Gln) amidotransferase subunit A
MNLLRSSVSDLQAAIQKGEVTSLKVTEACLSQIEKWDKKINSFITVNDKAHELAKKFDAKKTSGKLAGVPIAIKDLLVTEGIKTTAASKILSNFIPPYSSTVVRRLEAAGAIVLGKTNLDEFAMGSSSENSFYGPTRNPWNLDYVPGGSSGGSAACVAAGMAPASIGTDTGGSIRQPAHFCGLVGLKPTYGRVSRYGIVAFASSLDQAGPMTRTVRDAALIAEVISGHDERDSTTAMEKVPEFSLNISTNLKGKKVGLLKEYMSHDMDPETRGAVESAKKMLEDAGAQVVEVSIPLTKMAVPVYYMVATSEASSNLARYDGVRFGYRSDFSLKPAQDLAEFYSRTRGEGFGKEVKRRIVLGTYALSSGYYDAYYRKSGQVRRLLRDQFIAALKTCDFMLSPVTASPAFKVGERISDPLQMYLNDIFTTSANLVGMPALAVPITLSKAGLPIGIQLTARHFDEQTLFNAGAAIEERTGFEKRIPNVLQ